MTSCTKTSDPTSSMQIKGTQQIAASPDKIWDVIMDPNVLARITPGISRLEQVTPQKFVAVSEIKIGPVSGRFEGEVELQNIIDKERLTIVLNQKSRIGNVKAEIDIKITGKNGESVIDYTGEVKIAGTLAALGQRVMGGVVNSMSRQFFDDFKKEIDQVKL